MMSKWPRRLMILLMILAAGLLPGSDVECEIDGDEFEIDWPHLDIDHHHHDYYYEEYYVDDWWWW